MSLAFALSLGVLSYAALGAQAATVGVAAGCAAVLWGPLVARLAGGTLPPGSVPRASTSLLLASFVAVLAQDPAFVLSATRGPERLIAAASLCVVVSGLVQIAIGVLRLSQLARYVPYPFVAGFMCGIAVLVLLSQIRPLTGIASYGEGALGMLEIGTLLAGLATGGAYVAAQHRVTRVPALLIGFVAGLLVYYGIRAIVPQLPLGPVVGPVAGGLPLPTALLPLLDVSGADLARILPSLVASATLIAVFGTLDTLFAASLVDQTTNGRHDPRTEVIAHGLANVASGMCGGVPVAYSVACALAAFNAGGRGGRSLMVTLAAVTLTLIAGTGAIAYVPLVVLAGVVLVTSVSLIDRWVRGLVARLPRDAESRDPQRLMSLATVFIVALATVSLGFLPALAIGLVLSVLLTMVGMNRTLIRSVVSARERPSRRLWGTYDVALLANARERIKIVDLEGPLFFGSAERLAVEVERAVGNADVIVLDFRRVTSIDATASLLIEGLVRRMTATGVELVLAGVTPQGRHGRAFFAHSAFGDPTHRRWFGDADRAIEWAERRALERANRRIAAELSVEQLPLLKDLAQDQQPFVAEKLVRHDVGQAQVVYRENDLGDAVYLIAKGAVEITVMDANGHRSRIVTVEAGSLFGEAALLDGGERSATAVAVEPSVLYALSRGAFVDNLAVAHPRIANTMLVALSSQISLRLREMTSLVRRMDDARG